MMFNAYGRVYIFASNTQITRFDTRAKNVFALVEDVSEKVIKNFKEYKESELQNYEQEENMYSLFQFTKDKENILKYKLETLNKPVNQKEYKYDVVFLVRIENQKCECWFIDLKKHKVNNLNAREWENIRPQNYVWDWKYENEEINEYCRKKCMRRLPMIEDDGSIRVLCSGVKGKICSLSRKEIKS